MVKFLTATTARLLGLDRGRMGGRYWWRAH